MPYEIRPDFGGKFWRVYSHVTHRDVVARLTWERAHAIKDALTYNHEIRNATPR
jgi:hypothetical protein